MITYPFLPPPKKTTPSIFLPSNNHPIPTIPTRRVTSIHQVSSLSSGERVELLKELQRLAQLRHPHLCGFLVVLLLVVPRWMSWTGFGDRINGDWINGLVISPTYKWLVYWGEKTH